MRRSTKRPSEAGRRWVHVGHSLDPDARTAGAAATRQARGGDDPGLLMVFASFRYDLRELADVDEADQYDDEETVDEILEIDQTELEELGLTLDDPHQPDAE